jgi:predicted nucleic acid-binding Zn ribbon protein
VTSPKGRRGDRDEERRLTNLRRKQRRDRERLERDDAFLPTRDEEAWDVGEGPMRRRVPAPRALGELTGRVVSDKGWQDRLRTADVLRRWGAIVGETVAAHARPVRLAGGILVIAASDTTWATQVRYLADQIRENVNAHLPDGQAVRTVDVIVDRMPDRSGPDA